MLSVTTTTTFPPEIFACILSYLAERPFEAALDTHQVKCLQTCSLVCKQFSSISQRLLFERVEGFLASEPNSQPIHILKFIIDRAPIILHTVRELFMTISDPEDKEEPSDVESIDPSHLFFLQFRALVSLTIKRAPDSPWWTTLPTSRTFVATYAQQSTLQSLTLHAIITPDMWPHFLGSTSLKNLCIRNAFITPCDSTNIMPNISIKRLHLVGSCFTQGVAPVLSLFTALEVLELDLLCVTDPRNQQWIPSFKLKSIKIAATTHKIWAYSLRLLDGMLRAVKSLSASERYMRFQNLHMLAVPVTNISEWDVITSMLAIAHNIQQLDITVTVVYETDGCGGVRHMEPDIVNKCYLLTHLRLKIVCESHSITSTFTAIMSDIAVLVDSIATSTNILELFSFDIAILNWTLQRLALKRWDGIAAKLADASKFPNLRFVGVHIAVHPQDDNLRMRALQQYDGEEGLEAYLPRIMRKLGKRQDIELCAKLMLQTAQSES